MYAPFVLLLFTWRDLTTLVNHKLFTRLHLTSFFAPVLIRLLIRLLERHLTTDVNMGYNKLLSQLTYIAFFLMENVKNTNCWMKKGHCWLLSLAPLLLHCPKNCGWADKTATEVIKAHCVKICYTLKLDYYKLPRAPTKQKTQGLRVNVLPQTQK